MAALQTETKQPADKRPLAIDYYGQLPPGASVVSATVTAKINGTTTDATATVIQAVTPSVVGTEVWFGDQGGVSGTTYKITITATLSDGSVLEDDILLVVTET